MISDLDIPRMFCYPIVLIINFALWQYLTTIYYTRRSEPRVILLILCAFLGFIIIIPYAMRNDMIVSALNDISETTSMLAFLIQINIIGRDVQRKMYIRSVQSLTYVSELFIFMGLIIIIKSILELILPHLNYKALDQLDKVYQDMSLIFIFIFRFYYMFMSRGWSWMIMNKKLEMFLYLLFVTHEYPFIALNETIDFTWEPVQAVWHRVILMLCILVTIRDKLRQRSNATKPSQPGVVSSEGRPPSLAASRARGNNKVGEIIHLTGPSFKHHT